MTLIERLRSFEWANYRMRPDDAKRLCREAADAIDTAPPEEIPPSEATPAMLKAVSSILDPYPAKLVWKRMLEASRDMNNGSGS